MGGAKFCRFALFPLMLFMLLLLPTRMVAETTTEDPRCALFKGLEGISDVTFTDNGEYPWQMLDLKADGMENLGFTIPDGSKGLMSSNYHVDGSSSETVVNFTVEKPMLLTFKYLVSSEEFDEATITLDNKKSWTNSEINQIEIKELLSVGKHSLKLSYTKDDSVNENADRTCIYDLKTATTFSEYVADYVATNSTLTFKKITSDNLEGLDLSRMAVVDNIDMVPNVYTNYSSIKNIVFDESFKTYAPTSLSGFFNGCETLETISGLEYLNTANVEYMDNMFNGCSALTSLDLTKFNTAKVTDMNNMFKGCSALKSLDLTKFNTAKVTNMSFMFKGCSALTSLDLTNFNTANVTDMNNMFYGCSALKSLDLTNFNTAKVTDMSFMFYGCSALTSLDLTNFNTAKVEFMDNMFNGCSALTSLDLTNFNTAKVTYMNNMFEGCSALTTIYASDKFDTDNVRYGLDMFTGCKSLKDYSDSKTDHTYAYCGGTDGYFTPGGCGYAEFDNATGTLSFRYKGVKPEGTYNLNEGFTIPKWSDNRNKIQKVVFDASFANARPTSCYGWFWQCLNLNTIEGIEYLNTEKVTIMNSMFLECKALTSLDLTNFNTMNVTNMISMFGSCSALTTIYVSEKFVTNQVTNIYSRKMFYGCEKLNGYDDSKIDHTYANYKTGYFTKLVGKNGDEKIGASGEILTAESLTLDDDKDFVVYEPFAAKNAFYIRVIPEGSKWGTLCLPFAIDQSQVKECKFYRLTGIDKDCITLESYEDGAEIPAGTPVLFKMNEGVQELKISAQDADLVKEPVAGANTDVNLVGSFTKIGGNDNQGLADTDYIIGKDQFWLVSELNDGKGVGIKPMRAYIHPATASHARATMLSIGNGDGTTAIDNLNAISNDANVEYYDANGRRTNGLQKGLNIVKRGSKTYKIMVK